MFSVSVDVSAGNFPDLSDNVAVVFQFLLTVSRTLGVIFPLQRSREERIFMEKGSTLFERSEFVIPPWKFADRGGLRCRGVFFCYFSRLLKIYYACHCCVKILLKMLIYNLQTPLFRLILPCIGGAHNVFQKTCPCPSRKVEKKMNPLKNGLYRLRMIRPASPDPGFITKIQLIANDLKCSFSLLAQRKRTKRKGARVPWPSCVGLPCAPQTCRDLGNSLRSNSPSSLSAGFPVLGCGTMGSRPIPFNKIKN